MAQFASMLVLLTYAASVLGVSSLLNKPEPTYFLSPTGSLYTHMKTSTSSSTIQRTVPNNALTNDATLLHQILTQETTLRIELERKVTGILKELEQVKKTQVEAKTEQDSLKNDITLLRNENKQLKDDLDIMKRQLGNNSLSNSEPAICICDFSNITKELQNFKREIRYTSLTFLDLQRDVTNVQSAVKNLSISMEREKTNQAAINTDISVYQKNISNAIKDIRDVKEILVRIQHKQFEFSTDLENLKTNQTDMLVRVAFTATRTQRQLFTTETTMVFSNILTNIGGGYNAVTGVFTAPLGGVFVFNCKLTDNPNSGGPTIYFVKNGASQGFNIGNEGPTNSFRSSSSSIVLELIPGDRVWVKVVSSFFSPKNMYGEQILTGFLL